MSAEKTSGSVRGLSFGAMILGVLGFATFWWVPMGIVLSLTGLVVGFADCTMARRRSVDRPIAAVAIVVSLAALVLGIVIAWLGMQIWTFGGY